MLGKLSFISVKSVMKRVLTELLNLPEVVVESSLKEGETLILSVIKKTKSAVCPQCDEGSIISTKIKIT
ncbi:hypothetical protein [Scytonema sp. UIC 10036]|uniref:hypothetical protein n=1 Tax=Scytonema sp. UIC 10036 TaxID=2304196 RepID=UPI00325AAB1F